MKNQKGNSIITAPIIIAIGMVFVATLIVFTVKIVSPYIWYEKLSSTCMKYVFVIEEYGYLTKKEAGMLLSELENGGFEHGRIRLDYTSKKVNYGDEIFLKVDYDYSMDLPVVGRQTVPMRIEKYSICKR